MQKARTQREIEEFQKASRDLREAVFTALSIEQIVKWITLKLEKLL